MNAERLLENLRRLSDAPGVPGHEGEIADLIMELLGDAADETWRDPLGNLFVRKKGKSAKTLLLDAHMDEVGFMVQHVDDNGFISFVPLGGFDPRVLPAQPVLVHPKRGVALPGVIGSVPPHVQKGPKDKAPEIAELYIDIGVSSAARAAELGVQIGSPITLDSAFRRMGDGCVMGKAIDDRFGCAVIVEILLSLKGKKPDVTIVGSFSVMEEVGLRGAHVLAAQTEPAAAFFFEATTDASTPGVGVAQQPAQPGKGPAITVADNRYVAPARFLEFIEEVAASNKLPVQRKKPAYGGTNAGAVHMSHKGVLCGVISAPCRYLHTGRSMARIVDLENTAKLGLAAAKSAAKLIG